MNDYGHHKQNVGGDAAHAQCAARVAAQRKGCRAEGAIEKLGRKSLELRHGIGGVCC